MENQEWSDGEIAKLRAFLCEKITVYEAMGSAGSVSDDEARAMVGLCAEALKVFESEQQLRSQERDPKIIENIARYPVGTPVYFQSRATTAWIAGVVRGYERGGWIQVNYAEGPLSGTWTSVIQPYDIKPRAKRL